MPENEVDDDADEVNNVQHIKYIREIHKQEQEYSCKQLKMYVRWWFSK